MSQGEFLPRQSFVPLRPQGRLESNQPFALFYYRSWTKAGAGAKGKAGGTGGGGRMGRCQGATSGHWCDHYQLVFFAVITDNRLHTVGVLIHRSLIQ